MIPDTPPTTVTAAELQDWLDGPTPPRLLDVRSAGEFETAHIPGSYLVPLGTLREHRDELRQHLDEEVVLVCRSGARSTQAEQALASAGMSNVHVLDGGLTAWEAIGGDVRRGEQRWDLERQVRLVAGTLVAASGLASLRLPRTKWLGTAVGAGLATAALTDTCAMGAALAKLPYNRADEPDIDEIVRRLTDGPAAAA